MIWVVPTTFVEEPLYPIRLLTLHTIVRVRVPYPQLPHLAGQGPQRAPRLLHGPEMETEAYPG